MFVRLRSHCSTLFVDTIVQSGSNPAIMLVKELIENREITETKAAWALAAIGYYAKTPTRALLRELIVSLPRINFHESLAPKRPCNLPANPTVFPFAFLSCARA